MNILGKEYDGVLHIHIPKTAGSSIIKILQDNNLDNWKREYPRHHDPYFYMKQANNIDDKVFSVSSILFRVFHGYSLLSRLLPSRLLPSRLLLSCIHFYVRFMINRILLNTIKKTYLETII